MRALVIGGGLGGLAAGLGLEAVGAEVTICEAAPSARRGGGVLSLFPRGTAALACLGVDPAPGVPVTSAELVHSRSGRVMHRLDLNGPARRIGHPYSVASRDQVLDGLLDRIGARVEYGRRCLSVRPTGSGAEAEFDDGQRAGADLVVVADGANSAVRPVLWPDEQSRFLSVAWQAMTDRPPTYPPQQVTLLFHPGTFAGLFPASDGRLGWFVEQRADSPSEAKAGSRAAVLGRFGWLPDPFRECLATTADEAVESFPIYVRRPPRRWNRGLVAVLGDAAHTVSPAGGQGASEAFIDAVALADSIGHAGSLDAALERYTRIRAWRAQAVWRWSLTSMSPMLSRLSAMSLRLPTSFIRPGMERGMQPGRPLRRVMDQGLRRG